MTSRADRRTSQPTGADFTAVPAGLARLAEHQCGALTRRQLAEGGFTKEDIEAERRANRWRTFGRNVVVLQNAPLTAAQRDWVAVLLPGKSAALCGLSAATAAGLAGFEPERVHIVVAHATEAGMPTWIKVHESRRFSPDHIDPASSPPRTLTARSIIDGATWSQYPRRACAVLCAAVQQRLVTPGQLIGELDNAGAIRHVGIMRQVLGDISGGAHTLAEIDLGRVAHKAGLPPPRRQVKRRDSDGRQRYLDAEIDLPDGSALVVEIDGRGHLEMSKWMDDLGRQNDVVISGSTVLRFASLTLRLNEAKVVDQLRKMRLAHTP